MLYILVTIAALAALAAGLGWWGVVRFARQGREAQATLERVAQALSWKTSDLEALSGPVARYLGQALPIAGGPLRMARAKMSGHIRLKPEGPWQSWSGRQIWCLHPPAFVWSARMAAKPLMPVYVRDGLINGEGGLLVRLWGWLTMARATASPELDLGSLQRWLAEAPMFPPALLPGPELSWRDEGDDAATATLTSGGQRVEARFRFDPQGLPLTCRIAGRPRQQPDGSFVPTAWLARYGQWKNQCGMLLPTQCEAAWLLPEGEFSYLRLHIDQADFL
ncbi:MAG: hypothetical protein K9K36_04755 [Desulfarculaceae bacterium]|nr:hypothetical protein [Desulfarculaceae bacterium]MCF8048814.1 hypothetical protein [Desulfarculaceae bacterium]MCF8064532.1 hypothetical protein [Desulfarculaceae bacterium]MCF8121961.1 hypothetical protein [Desulfarculaceae bacterium]